MIRRYENTSISNVGGYLRLPANIEIQHLHKVISRVQYLNPGLRLRLQKELKLYLSDNLETEVSIYDHTNVPLEETMDKIRELMKEPVFGYDKALVYYHIFQRTDEIFVFGIYDHLICDGLAFIRIVDEFRKMALDPGDILWSSETMPDQAFIEYLSEEQSREKKLSKTAEEFIQRCSREHINFPVRREGGSGLAGIFSALLPQDFYDRMDAAGREKGLSIEQIYQAALYLIYSLITGKEWISIGRVLIGRRKKTLSTVGMFSNTLPLAVQVGREESFETICKKIKKAEFQMLSYSDLDPEGIRKANRLTNNLYDTTITYRPLKRHPFGREGTMPEIENDRVEVPLRILIDEREDGVHITYKYMRQVYEEREVERLHELILGVMEAGIAHNETAESFTTFVCKDLQNRAAEPAFKQTDGNIAKAFREHAKDHPNDIYIIDESETRPKITYADAAGLVDDIKCRLYSEYETYGRKDGLFLVGLKLKRTFRLPLTCLACLELGAVWVPVSIDETAQRTKELADSFSILVDDSWFEDEASNRQTADVGSLYIGNEEGIAYGIHTSGTTGRKKLALLYERSLQKRLSWMLEEFQLTGCRVLQKTKNVFDVSVWELLLPALAHGSLVMLPDGMERDPEAIAGFVERYEADTLHFVPSMLSVSLSWLGARETRKEKLRSVKRVIASGEVLHGAVADRFFELLPGKDLYNLYGPAECTIDVSFHRCVRGEKVIPIGREVADSVLRIVNEKGDGIPDGFIGQIEIRGGLVGKGYFDNPEETGKHFFEENGVRCYLTGDSGYKNAGGEIIYTGRIDREIKLRGMRIDPAFLEKEAVLIDGIEAAAAMPVDGRLVLFVVSKYGVETLKRELAKRVAPHYIPDRVFGITAMPFTENGKTDYAALAEICTEKNKETGKAEQNAEDLSETEKVILREVKRILSVRQIGVTDSLREFGLDSLSLVELLVTLDKKGYSLKYEDIASCVNIREIALLASDTEGKDDSESGFCHEWPLPEIGEVHVSNGKKFFLGIPYAGADVTVFDGLAKKLSERGGRFVAFDISKADTGLSDMAERIVMFVEKRYLIREADRGKIEITVIGCCVGSSLAIEIVRELSRISQLSVRLVLIGALPAEFLGDPKQQKLAWDRIPYAASALPIRSLHGKKVSMTQEMYERLKEEARAYVALLHAKKEERVRPDKGTLLLFGDRDVLTKGYAKRYTEWERYIAGSVQVRTLRGAWHFCLTSHADEIAGLLR